MSICRPLSRQNTSRARARETGCRSGVDLFQVGAGCGRPTHTTEKRKQALNMPHVGILVSNTRCTCVSASARQSRA